MDSLYFEDFRAGMELVSPKRTISETDVVLFASLTGDNNAMHTDEHLAKKSMYGGRIVHGLLSLAMANGLMQRLNILYSTGFAFLGLNSVKFLLPVKIGDTVYARLKVLNTRPTGKSERGLVEYSVSLFNQDDKEVLTSEHVILVLTKRAQAN